jgi:hypothetical protein
VCYFHAYNALEESREHEAPVLSGSDCGQQIAQARFRTQELGGALGA